MKSFVGAQKGEDHGLERLCPGFFEDFVEFRFVFQLLALRISHFVSLFICVFVYELLYHGEVTAKGQGEMMSWFRCQLTPAATFVA